MAMGGNVTHCEKRMTSWVRIPITTPSFFCPDGGMVDTVDSKSTAERRPGSSPG